MPVAGDRGVTCCRVHVVSLAGLVEWTREKEGAGVLVDPKVWAGLSLTGLRP